MIKLSVVQKRFLSGLTTLFSFTIIIAGCAKLDTTDIGADLLPAVDNVHTFEATFPINTVQGIFNPDTTVITSTDDQVLGKINNDPLFGTTKADIYAQFKPGFYPYYYGNANDTIVGFDSVVLCLSYKGFWGDSTIPMQFEVREVSNTAGGLWDSLYQSRNVNFAPPTGNVIGSTIVDFKQVGNYVVYANKKDSVKNHIRIKLSSSFANSLFARDTLVMGNNSLRSDSAFRLFNKGFAILANGSGNGLMYTNLTDTSSRLEVHFRRKNGGAVDTTFSSLRLITASGTGTFPSVTANNIVRNRAGSPAASPSPTDIYLQTSPGTYANLTIPALDTISNKIIHRAEIIIEQVPTSTITDSMFSAPDFLYLDLIDTGAAKWKPMYFDLNPSVFYDPDYIAGSYFPSGGIDYIYHGGYVRNKLDIFGNNIKFYNFNITRYVQQIITKHTPNYQLRLSAPYTFSYPQFYPSSLSGNNSIAKGRIRIGSGINANYRMRFRIVYSNI